MGKKEYGTAFDKLFARYGLEIEHWPEAVRQDAEQRAGFRAACEAERALQEQLHKNAHIVPNPGFASRIVHEARFIKPQLTLWQRGRYVLQDLQNMFVLPQPAFMMSLALAAGILAALQTTAEASAVDVLPDMQNIVYDMEGYFS